MNWHAVSFFLDIALWIVLAVAFYHGFLKRIQQHGLFVPTLFLSFFAGIGAIMNHGLPDIGISLISLWYVGAMCCGIACISQISKQLFLQSKHMQQTRVRGGSIPTGSSK